MARFNRVQSTLLNCRDGFTNLSEPKSWIGFQDGVHVALTPCVVRVFHQPSKPRLNSTAAFLSKTVSKETGLFRFRANLPWMFAANVRSELAVTLAFILSSHFLYRVTDQRTRSCEYPTAFRAAIAAKSCGRDPDDSARHEAMYTKLLRGEKRQLVC
jgi:hypothetical protein